MLAISGFLFTVALFFIGGSWSMTPSASTALEFWVARGFFWLALLAYAVRIFIGFGIERNVPLPGLAWRSFLVA